MFTSVRLAPRVFHASRFLSLLSPIASLSTKVPQAPKNRALNWSLNADGISPIASNVHYLINSEAIKNAALPLVPPLLKNDTKLVEVEEDADANEILMAGGPGLSYDDYDEQSEMVKRSLSKSSILYVAEGAHPSFPQKVEGSRKNTIRVITNDAIVAQLASSQLSCTSTFDYPLQFPLTAFVFSAGGEEISSSASSSSSEEDDKLPPLPFSALLIEEGDGSTTGDENELLGSLVLVAEKGDDWKHLGGGGSGVMKTIVEAMRRMEEEEEGGGD